MKNYLITTGGSGSNELTIQEKRDLSCSVPNGNMVPRVWLIVKLKQDKRGLIKSTPYLQLFSYLSVEKVITRMVVEIIDLHCVLIASFYCDHSTSILH